MGGDEVIDPEKLLLRLSEGKELKEHELAHVIQLIDSVDAESAGRTVSIDDLYSFVVVLKNAKAVEARYVLERLLELRDPLTVALVLETLVFEWGLHEEYLERVVNFALGVSWDEDQDVQQAALKILGEYLAGAFAGRKDDSSELDAERVLELVFSVFEDQKAEQWTRQTAYYALCRAGGKSWEELPPECAMLDLQESSDDIDRKLLEQLRERSRRYHPGAEAQPHSSEPSSDSPSPGASVSE